MLTLGYSRQLIKKYCDSGWIERIGHGAYRKAGDKITWAAGIYALQQETDLQIHIGAITALELAGLSHFIPLGSQRPIHIWKHDKHSQRLPEWLTIGFYPQLFSYYDHNLFNPDEGIGLQKKEIEGLPIKVSCPERAIFEFLDQVPRFEKYEHACYLIEGLHMLRSEILQLLLEHCTSIKVKRLFLHLCDKENLQFMKQLDLTKVNLGSGKRVIKPGGKFDPKYKLSVPKKPELEDESAIESI